MEKPLPFEDMKDIDDRFWATIEQERRYFEASRASAMNNSKVAKTTEKGFIGNC